MFCAVPAAVKLSWEGDFSLVWSVVIIDCPVDGKKGSCSLSKTHL